MMNQPNMKTLLLALLATVLVLRSVLAEPAAAPTAVEWSEELVAEILADARTNGDPRRGAGVFSVATSACTSCHKVAGQGGMVGPELTTVAKCLSPEEIVESLLWPDRQVKPEYRGFAITTADGRGLLGIIKEDTSEAVVLVDATGQSHRIPLTEIEDRREVGSLMPKNVVTALPSEQRRDLVRYLLELGRTPGLETLSHRPGAFDVPAEPLHPDDWPNRGHAVNKHRVYDPYTKQARQFRGRQPMPLLLPAWPDIDGARFGHFGSIGETQDERRNQTDLGSLQSWPLSVEAGVITREV